MNQAFRAINKLSADIERRRFDHKLTHDEVRELNDKDFAAYVDWLFAYNAPLSVRWTKRQTPTDDRGYDEKVEAAERSRDYSKGDFNG